MKTGNNGVFCEKAYEYFIMMECIVNALIHCDESPMHGIILPMQPSSTQQETNAMHHATFYGSVLLERATCPKCNCVSILDKDGNTLCCDVKVKSTPTRFTSECCSSGKRVKLKKSTKDAYLELYDYCCAYCGRAFGDYCIYNDKVRRLRVEWDHFEPFVDTQNNDKYNYVPACQICNSIKGSKRFNSFKEVRDYVKKIWRERGEDV